MTAEDGTKGAVTFPRLGSFANAKSATMLPAVLTPRWSQPTPSAPFSLTMMPASDG